MHNRILNGKIEFMIVASVNLTLSILIAPITFILIPVIYLLMFWALYRGHRSVRGLIAFLNLLGVLLFSSITFSHHSFLEYSVNLVIPAILIKLTLLIFVGKSKHFLKYKSLYRQKKLSQIFDNEDENY